MALAWTIKFVDSSDVEVGRCTMGLGEGVTLHAKTWNGIEYEWESTDTDLGMQVLKEVP